MLSAARAVVVAIAALGLAASASVAQDGRYSSDWRGREAAQAAPASDRLQELVDELNRLIDSAANANAADPVLLRDLRDLARRYDWPWRNRVLFDDFSDGNVTADPRWTVQGAPVSADRLDGLRTSVSLTPAPSDATTGEAEKPGDVAAQILGQLLQQRAGGDSRSSATAAARPSESVLVARAATANAFAVLADIVFLGADGGEFQLGVVQGPDNLGYRTALRPGPNGTTVEILRVGSRGTGVVDRVDVAQEVWGPPSSTQPRAILFSRDAAGDMRVSLDGTVVLTTSDRGFRDRFDGFILRNDGGDYLVKSIAGYSQ